MTFVVDWALKTNYLSSFFFPSSFFLFLFPLKTLSVRWTLISSSYYYYMTIIPCLIPEKN